MGKLFADDMVHQTLQGATHDKPGYIALFKSGELSPIEWTGTSLLPITIDGRKASVTVWS